MSNAISMLRLILLGLLTIVSPPEVTAVSRHACTQWMPLQPNHSAGNMEMAMDETVSGRKQRYPAKQAEYSRTEGVLVGDIQFGIEKCGTEKVCFVLNPFSNPTIFSLEGSNPRIVIDIKEVPSWSGKSRMSVNGLLIKQWFVNQAGTNTLSPAA
ncbi:MAG: hypothetical protein JRL30_07475 [Deltaproteobacteria bacterium]|nr:hypothetical protein [Deltaproteobacteria bacterium]